MGTSQSSSPKKATAKSKYNENFIIQWFTPEVQDTRLIYPYRDPVAVH